MAAQDLCDEIGQRDGIVAEERAAGFEHPVREDRRSPVEDRRRGVLFLQGVQNPADELELLRASGLTSWREQEGEVDVAEGRLIRRAVRAVQVRRHQVRRFLERDTSAGRWASMSIGSPVFRNFLMVGSAGADSCKSLEV